MQYKEGTTVFGSWTIERKIGEGSFGQVFALQRKDFGQVYRAALKVIRVPQNDSELQAALAEGMTPEQAEQYFYSVVEDIVREFAIMARLKGTANVVSYEDHAVYRHPDGIGWDILIRMELLTPLLPYAYQNPFTKRDIIRLGIDMCKALELCQKYNIIHRDLKPENIFVSDNGDFKLGDFGIARTVEKTTSSMSKKGTYSYMAPEVYRGEEYGYNVDIYSLGIVLYRLLNKNRIPFLPPAPEPITYHKREAALELRMSGQPISKPFHAEGRLAEIVLKACAFSPRERYSSPAQMRQELEAILYDQSEAELIYPSGDELSLVENRYATQSKQPPFSPPVQPSDAPGDKTESVFAIPSQAAPAGAPIPAAAYPPDEDRTQSIFQNAPTPPPGSSRPGTPTVGRPEDFSPPQPQSGCIDSTYATNTGTNHDFGNAPDFSDAVLTASAKKHGGKKVIILASVLTGVLLLGAAGSALYLTQAQGKKQEQYQQLMHEGTALFQTDPQAAGQRFLAAQDLYPNDPEAYTSYAYSLYCGNDFAGCVTYIEDTLAMGKQYDIETQNDLNEILGAAHFELGDYAAAAAFFRTSAAGGDMTVSAMRDYAVSLGRLGSVTEADAVLDKMFQAGANEDITNYVQAEVDFALKNYSEAERGFQSVLDTTQDVALQKRSLRSLAEVYRACAPLDRTGQSPIANPATKEVDLLNRGIAEYNLQHDSTLWEMLAMAYFEAYHTDPSVPGDYLNKAAECFTRVLEMGVTKDYLYGNLYTINYELGNYTAAEQALTDYETQYPNAYMPHALRGMLLITIENNKAQENRNYSAAKAEYVKAGDKLRSDDDATYYQQLGSLIGRLEQEGWL